jgi:hypothetical protein
MSTDLDFLDLDADRQSRAAAREGRGQGLPVRVGGETIAVLPAELPLDVLSPLREIDEDLALMLRSVMQATQGTGQTATEATNLVIDLLVANPHLPTKVLDTAVQISKNLLTDAGYERFMAARPSREDIAFVAKGVFRFYGLSLGEASASSDSSGDGGGTSKPTSPTTTPDSTPEGSTSTPDAQPTPTTPPTEGGQRPLAS